MKVSQPELKIVTKPQCNLSNTGVCFDYYKSLQLFYNLHQNCPYKILPGYNIHNAIHPNQINPVQTRSHAQILITKFKSLYFKTARNLTKMTNSTRILVSNYKGGLTGTILGIPDFISQFSNRKASIPKMHKYAYKNQQQGI